MRLHPASCVLCPYGQAVHRLRLALPRNTCSGIFVIVPASNMPTIPYLADPRAGPAYTAAGSSLLKPKPLTFLLLEKLFPPPQPSPKSTNHQAPLQPFPLHPKPSSTHNSDARSRRQSRTLGTMDRPSHDFTLYPSHLSVMPAGYRFPYTPIRPSSSPISTTLAELRAGPRSNRRPWLRNGSPEFVTAQADDDMFVSSPSVSGRRSVPALSLPGPSAPATSRVGPSAPQPAGFGPFAPDPSIAGPSAPEQTSFGPFVFSPSDFSDENVPPPAAMPFAGTVVRWGTPEPEEPAAARLQSAADFAAFAARPAVDFEAPMMSPVRRGLRRSRLRGDESMADGDGNGDNDDDDLDPEECSTQRYVLSSIPLSCG